MSRRITAIMVIVICVLMLGTLASSSYFTSSAVLSPQQISAGTIKLNLDINDPPWQGFGWLLHRDHKWIPGDHGEALCTISNVGSLPAKWRMGITAETPVDKDFRDKDNSSLFQA